MTDVLLTVTAVTVRGLAGFVAIFLAHQIVLKPETFPQNRGRTAAVVLALLMGLTAAGFAR